MLKWPLDSATWSSMLVYQGSIRKLSGEGGGGNYLEKVEETM